MNRYVPIICLLIVASLSARILRVGPSKALKSVSGASINVQDGDTVEIDKGLFSNEACIWSANNTVIRGTEKYAHLKAPAVIPNQKAILVISGNNTVIENIEFSEATVPDKNGAGIRLEGKNTTIRNCYFHHCEDGILGGKGYVVIENSEFAFCGFGDGYSHNMYISDCDSFLLRFCYTHDVKEGHTIKSRARRNYILYNRIESGNSTASYEVNLPNGGISFIIGNQIQQGANSHNSAIIDFGSEGLALHDSALYVVNNTVVNDRGSGTFIKVRNTDNRPKVYNNIFTGAGIVCNMQIDSAGNYIGSNPGFVSKNTFDYHLIKASPGRNRGINPGKVDNIDLMPIFEYIHNLSAQPRVIKDGVLDAGAFEYEDVGLTFGIKSYNTTQKKAISTRWYNLNGRRISRNDHIDDLSELKSDRLYKFRFLVFSE